MPITFDAVPMSRGGIYTEADQINDWVGTDGLGTCLGVYVSIQPDVLEPIQNFIAHISCDVQVPAGPGNGNYDYVVDETHQLIFQLLGAFDAEIHNEIGLFSTGGDYSTDAMRDGFWLWCGTQPAVTAAAGFRVEYNGLNLTQAAWNDPTNPIPGQFDCNIAVPQAAGDGGDGGDGAADAAEGAPADAAQAKDE